MPLSTLALFAVAAFALALTPGPDMLFCLSRSIGQGRRAGFASLLGILTGCYVWAAATALGLAGMLAAAPAAYEVVRLAGATYLAWLAVRTFMARDAILAAGPGAPARLWTLYAQGLLTNLLNPKVALFFLALLPQFIDPARGSVLGQALLLATILNALGLLVNGAVITAADRVARWLGRSREARLIQRWIMGTIFGGLALRLAVERR